MNNSYQKILINLKFGKKNLLEVTVSKESANAGVNLAERRADYWNFGGIFRPVFLEVNPAIYINQLSIDATADGVFKANCYLNRAMEGASLKTVLFDNKGNKVTLEFIINTLKEAKVIFEQPLYIKAEDIPKDIGFYMMQIAKRSQVPTDVTRRVLSAIPVSLRFSILLREVAIYMDNQYPGHIKDSKTQWYISYTGEVLPVNIIHIDVHQTSAFRTEKDANLAIEILRPLYNARFGKK